MKMRTGILHLQKNWVENREKNIFDSSDGKDIIDENGSLTC